MAKANTVKTELPAETGSTTGKPLADEGQPATPPAAPSVSIYRVEVFNMPPREVEAKDEAEAWEVYRKLFNVTSTVHPVKATRRIT